MCRTGIRVLVVDDHPATRAGLAALLTANPAFALMASAATGEEAVDLFIAVVADLVIVDQRLPGIDGAETVRRIRLLSPRTRIVMISMFDPPEEARATADTFLFKSEVRQKLIPTIEALFPDHQRSDLL